MKRILIFLIVVMQTSCVVTIPERNIFTRSAYNADVFSGYVQKSSFDDETKIAMIEMIERVANSDEKAILRSDAIEINRDFFTVNDSTTLEYFDFKPANFDKTGLFFLGNGSSIFSVMNQLQRIAQESNSRIYVLNYRGYGKSQGTPSFSTLFHDNNKFLDHIRETTPEIDFVMGYSLGSISATYLAVDKVIDQLILLAPLSNSGEMIDSMKRKNAKGFKAIMGIFVTIKSEDYIMEISNTRKLANFAGELIVLHAKNDQTLPYSMAESIMNSCNSSRKKLITIEDGGHSAPFRNENVTQIIEIVNSLD